MTTEIFIVKWQMQYQSDVFQKENMQSSKQYLDADINCDKMKHEC